MTGDVRILLLADSHLGLDLPSRPRVARRRRGHDFLANHAAALAPALRGEVDLVVHGGDVFDRPRVPPSLAWQAYAPLLRVAERGVPVFVVPGNHERARLPHAHLLAHPNVRVFERPRTHVLEVRGVRVALAGFPYQWRGVRERFPALLDETGWRAAGAELWLLCVHQCFEGARVGPADFTFRSAADVVCAGDVPAAFAAVLSGHIHRQQVLTRDLRGRALAAPVLYPGSVERTAAAEIGEAKGYLLLRLRAGVSGAEVHWEPRPLPARPMLVRTVAAGGAGGQLAAALRAAVAAAPADAVLQVRITGAPSAEELRSIAPARLREFVPPTMNVEVCVPPAPGAGIRRRGRRLEKRTAAPGGAAVRANLQLEL